MMTTTFTESKPLAYYQEILGHLALFMSMFLVVALG